MFLIKIARKIKNLIFPEYCYGCNLVIMTDGGKICFECWSKIGWIIKPYCDYCGMSLDNYNDNMCDNCDDIKLKRYHYKSRSACIYNESVDKFILMGKNYGRTANYKMMSLWLLPMLDEFIEESKIDYIIPVPLSRKKFLLRGYNHVVNITKEISKELKIKTLYNVLFRIKYYNAQQGLNRDMRLSNVKDNFIVKNNELIKDKVILLVDDVITTGATVNECSKVLCEAGVSRVYIVSIARVPKFR